MYERQIEVGGNPIAVRELTLKDYRSWLKDMIDQAAQEEIPLYSIDRDLFKDMALTDLPRFTDLTPERIDGMTGSQVRQVIEAVKKANPDFFAMRERMRNTASQVIGLMEKHLKDLSAPPAPLSSTDTTMSGPTP